MIDASQLIRPDEPFVLRQRRPDLADDDAFLHFARGLEGLRVESEEGEVIIVMSPAGWETGARNAIITEQLTAWARATRLGRATDSSALYRLRRGVRRAPAAAWISFDRLASVPAEQRQGVLPIPPDFAIELRSPTDSLDELKDKMRAYIQAGVRLAWLIDPSTRTVYEYRTGTLSREYQQPQTMSADPVLPGFVLDLAEIWQAQ
jgi:Uma2 family endonuclease